jgi:hypothetical protein
MKQNLLYRIFKVKESKNNTKNPIESLKFWWSSTSKDSGKILTSDNAVSSRQRTKQEREKSDNWEKFSEDFKWTLWDIETMLIFQNSENGKFSYFVMAH